VHVQIQKRGGEHRLRRLRFRAEQRLGSDRTGHAPALCDTEPRHCVAYGRHLSAAAEHHRVRDAQHGRGQGWILIDRGRELRDLDGIFCDQIQDAERRRRQRVRAVVCLARALRDRYR
jgi:hypothetical protein